MSAESVSARPRLSFQEEIAPRKQEKKLLREARRDDKNNDEGVTRNKPERGRRRGRGRDGKDQLSVSPTPNPPQTTNPGTGTTTPVTTQPVGTATPVQSSDARTLAERYVSQFEEQSGNKLDPEERTAKVNEIANFYDSPSRSGRLSKIVFA